MTVLAVGPGGLVSVTLVAGGLIELAPARLRPFSAFLVLPAGRPPR